MPWNHWLHRNGPRQKKTEEQKSYLWVEGQVSNFVGQGWAHIHAQDQQKEKESQTKVKPGCIRTFNPLPSMRTWMDL